MHELIDVFEDSQAKLAMLMREAEEDVRAYKHFPSAHHRQLHSTNPLERLNYEIKRRTRVIGIFPNDASITRLVGATMMEQNDEWAISQRYMSLETIESVREDAAVDPVKLAALNGRRGVTPHPGTLHHARYRRKRIRWRAQPHPAFLFVDGGRPQQMPADTRRRWVRKI